MVKLCSGSRYGEITMPMVSNINPRGVDLVQRQTAGLVKQGTKAGNNIRHFARLPEPAMDIMNLRAAGRPGDSLVFYGPRGNKWAYQPYWRPWDTLGKGSKRRSVRPAGEPISLPKPGPRALGRAVLGATSIASRHRPTVYWYQSAFHPVNDGREPLSIMFRVSIAHTTLAAHAGIGQRRRSARKRS